MAALAIATAAQKDSSDHSTRLAQALGRCPGRVVQEGVPGSERAGKKEHAAVV